MSPLVSAATNKTVTSGKVRLSLTPLGTFPYDGMTLPLVSPDARFIAVQEGGGGGGQASWAELVGAAPPPGSARPTDRRIRIYRIASGGGAEGQAGMARGKWGGGDLRGAAEPDAPMLIPMPVRPDLDGLLLGRSCDADGFLVVRSLPGAGSRVGIVSWTRPGEGDAGEPLIQWLPLAPGQSPGDAARSAQSMATFLPSPGAGARRIAMCVRDDPAAPQDLQVVDLGPGGVARSAPRRLGFAGVSLVMPLGGASAQSVFVQAVPLSRGGAAPRVLCIDIPPNAGSLRVKASGEWPDAATVFSAFQSAAPAQTPWPPAAGGAGVVPDGITLFDSESRRAMFVNAEAGVEPLTRGSVLGVPLMSEEGCTLAVATDRALALHPVAPTLGRQPAIWSPGGVPLMRGALVPRAVMLNSRPALVVLELNPGDANSSVTASVIEQPVQGRVSDSE